MVDKSKQWSGFVTVVEATTKTEETIERLRTAFTANGKREIRVYVFLK